MTDQQNNNHVAIVTGAGSGIGRATALMLAQSGYDVALVGRTKSKLVETGNIIAEHTDGARVATITCDLTDAAEVAALPQRVVAHFGGLSAIANVAGDAPSCPIESITPDMINRCLSTNVSAIVQLTAAAWPILREGGGGTIVNVSSMASFDPFPGFGIYAPAKAAVNMFTLVTAREGADVSIKAVAVAPGAVETPMLRGLFDESMLPKDKTLAPESIAEIIVGCITGSREFEPGETIQAPSPM